MSQINRRDLLIKVMMFIGGFINMVFSATKSSYRFDDVIPMTNKLAKAFHEEVDIVKQQFIVADLIVLLELLTRNHCKKFITRCNAFELDLEEAVVVCLGKTLNSALNKFDESRGDFLALYCASVENELKALFRSATTKKEKFNQSTVSGDVNYSNKEEGATLFEVISKDDDMAETICDRLVLEDLIKSFEEIDQYGKLIRIEMYGNKTDKTRAILEYLGAEEYGASERQLVRRTKQRFKKFLLNNNISPDMFLK